MTIESYSLVEHFDYMCKCVPQPFMIPSDTVKSFSVRINEDGEKDYCIETNKHVYTLTLQSVRKLVDTLGIKSKLLNQVCSETDVFDLTVPIINKLLKCFSDCFAFYATGDDALTIIDLNVNMVKGEEGTKYELGPSPWTVDVSSSPSSFTCFADFKDKYSIDDKNDTDLLVKAEDLMQGTNVNFALFKTVVGANLQPMLVFSSKFTNMRGFSDIHPMLYDEVSDTKIVFPINYAKDSEATMNDLLRKVTHLYESTDMNDFIFREVNELASSDDTPNPVKAFIADILVNSVINLNQPVKDILTESVTITNNMKPSKKAKFKKQLGALLGWCFVAKHACCEHCGHMDIN